MKQRYYTATLLLLLVLLGAGCKKYLTVQPESSYTEDQVFSNETATEQALNGLYNDMADNSLYGATMTTTTLELMGQHWNNGGYSTEGYNEYLAYAYTQSNVLSTFSLVWQNSYAAILAANKFISKLDATAQSGVLSQAHANLMKGEAIAVRAFLHFDMLRLFGPVYLTSADQQAIPYYRSANGESQPIITARQALDSVLADYAQAETLLAPGDPVLTGGITFTQDFYSGYRNERMNYYAVKGLMARAYLYGGYTSPAHDSARAALTQGEKWFPWAGYAVVLNAGATPDRIFSSEVLFGVYNQDMYTNYTTYFSSSLQTADMLAPLTPRLTATFESNTNDYRYASWFSVFPSFDKFKDIGDDTKPWRFIQPLLRKSELYYIIAETDPSPAVAFAALDSVRYNRGLGNLAPTAVLQTEIQKEYQKEFWGEGQVFFYYKRTNASTIPSATSQYANVYTTAATYVVPLPLSETTPR
jgi:hypothetical protein